MKGAPRSKHFDDVYFSAEDGFAETQHVFIKGNNLPEKIIDTNRFCVAETGFGTGLNMLSAWTVFEQIATKGQHLEFLSFEKYPLAVDEIKDALQPWVKNFETCFDRLLEAYPLLISGYHVISLTDQVTLTLVFGDVNQALPEAEASVDCWFLDGFRPAANPEMWTDTVFEHVLRLTKQGGSFSTFTAAGFVRRGLEAAGFSVEKVPGFGRKREMLVGRKSGISL